VSDERAGGGARRPVRQPMNTVNTTALFRSLIVYAICVPLAVVIGYEATDLPNYGAYGSYVWIGVLIAVLAFPLMMKWHYPLLVFSWSCPMTLFFLPGSPGPFLVMTVVSLTISVVERILDKNKTFITPSAVAWPLLMLLAVMIFTGELTGGFGLHSMGSDVYGGKKYVTMTIGILSFFAITARPISKKSANWYVFLFFSGSFFNAISDFYPVVPESLRHIYVLFPAVVRNFDAMGNAELQLGVTRMFGISVAAGSFFIWMLARYGVRDLFFSGKIWRPLAFGLAFVLIFAGGFRSAIIIAVMVFAMIFFLEKMHQTVLMLPIILFSVMAGVALVPLAPHLPYTFQRALAFLPLNIDPMARMDAEGSTQWRLDMWSALLPEMPNYLLLGKGYAFSAQTYNEFMGANATFKPINDPLQDPLTLSSDFHSGPLSVIISFGIWGVLAWLWYMAAGFRVVWRNYHYGDPALRHPNLLLFAFFVAKLFSFFFIFGGIVDDVAGFGGIIGLSIALNHGVRRPQPQPKTNPTFTGPRFDVPAKPAFQR
jgi:hypothetical protein